MSGGQKIIAGLQDIIDGNFVVVRPRRVRRAAEVLPTIERPHEVFSRVSLCSKCGEAHDREGQRYCLACHDTYMREWRKTHPLVGESKRKDRVRSYANQYKKRGLIEQTPCIVCGDPNSEMHHPDYNRPLYVQWLCRPCHLDLHKLASAVYDAEKLKDAILERRALIAALKEDA